MNEPLNTLVPNAHKLLKPITLATARRLRGFLSCHTITFTLGSPYLSTSTQWDLLLVAAVVALKHVLLLYSFMSTLFEPFAACSSFHDASLSLPTYSRLIWYGASVSQSVFFANR